MNRPTTTQVQMENKIVPELRFPEFRDEAGWKEYTLAEISDRVDGKVGNALLTTVSIAAGTGFVTQLARFSRDISGEQYKNYIVLKEGDFAYNKGNSRKYPQGCIYKLKEFKIVAAPNAFICFRFKSNFVADFYQGYFDNNYHGKQLQKFITSGARMDGLLNISPNDFFSIKLPTPKNKNEQQKIASCLSSIDELITAQGQKLAVLKTHKKGLMRQLFPAEGETVPKLRFQEFGGAGQWKVNRLCDIGNVLQGYGFPEVYQGKTKGEYPFYKVSDISNTIQKGSHYIEIATNYIDNIDLGLIKAKTIPIGTTIFAKIGEAIRLNRRALTTCESVIDNNTAGVKAIKGKATDNFIFCILSQINLIEYSGGAIPSVNKTALENIQVLTPSECEQQKIAECLSSIDELITVQSQKLDALKVHKKGLLQQLFPTLKDTDR